MFIILLICISYGLITLFLYFNKYIDLTNPKIEDKFYKVSGFISVCSVFVFLNWLYYYRAYQQIGYDRDLLQRSIYDYINYEYLEYLENIEKKEKNCAYGCSINLVNTNTIDNLKNYIVDMQRQVVLKNNIDDLSSLSVEQIKKYTVNFSDNTEEKSFYNQIRDAIMTYYLISNFAQTKYEIILTKYFFDSKVSVLGTINANKNNLFTFIRSIDSCLNIDIDGVKNNSDYMKHICTDCVKIRNTTHKHIGVLIDRLSNYQFSLQFFLIFAISIMCLVYIYTYSK